MKAPGVSSFCIPLASRALTTLFINLSWASTDATGPTQSKIRTSSNVPP